MTFEELKPYWDALDRLFPEMAIRRMTPQQLADYELICTAIVNTQEEAPQ